MRSPIKYMGGKGKMAAKLLPLFPPHKHYVEPFCGGASLLFAKQPAGGIEVINDLNGDLVGFFRVLRDQVLGAELKRLAELTPYSRQEYGDARELLRNGELDPLKRAHAFLVVARQSFGGNFGSGWGLMTDKPGGAGPKNWRSVGYEAIGQRLLQVHIEHRDWRFVVETYDAPWTLIYCDPPYPAKPRRAGIYEHEMSDEDHADLLEALCDYPEMVVLSSYPSEMYEDALRPAGWAETRFEMVCHAAGRTRHMGILGKGAALEKQPRTECVWRNPAAVEASKRGQLYLW